MMKDRPHSVNLTIRYLTLLVLLGGSVGGYAYFEKERTDAVRLLSDVHVFVSQEQRLTQRLAFLSQSLIQSSYEQARDAFRKEILSLTPQLEAVHSRLVQGPFLSRLGPPSRSKIHTLFFEPPLNMDEDIRRFLASARSLAQQPSSALTAYNPHNLFIQSFAQSEQGGKGLMTLLKIVEEEGGAREERAKSLGDVFLAAVYLLLAGTVFLVFRPMKLKIKKEFETLNEYHGELDRKADELSQSNVKLKEKESAFIEIMEDLAVKKKRLQEEVAERVRVEKALERERNTAKMYLELAGVMFVLIGRNEKILLINKKGCELLGGDEKEIVGMNWFDHFIPESDRPMVRRVFEQLMTGGVPSVEYFENDIRTLKGETRRIEWHNTMIRDDNGTIVAALSSGLDVTEKVRAAEKQSELMAQLENANRELNEFAYVVSHDLKAPLRGIGSLADWLIEDYSDKLDKEGTNNLRMLKSRVKRMHDLIEGLLTLARIGRTEGERTAVDLNRLVHDVIDFVSPPKNIKLIVDDGLPVVYSDPTRLQQVFQNLISNAVKYIEKPKGEIRIVKAEDDGSWKFGVKDNGPGIERRHQEKIFKIFQTLSPRDSYESTGVGLSIVKKIIETYGGRIWVESDVGKGSTFYFTLPKTRYEEVEREKAA